MSDRASAMATIRVVGIASGSVPQWVREAWVGCVMTTINEMVEYSSNTEMNAALQKLIMPGPSETFEDFEFAVRQDLAMQALAKQSAAAAQWYRDECRAPVPGHYFYFPVEVVELCCEHAERSSAKVLTADFRNKKLKRKP